MLELGEAEPAGGCPGMTNAYCCASPTACPSQAGDTLCTLLGTIFVGVQTKYYVGAMDCTGVNPQP
jgi:hypothetical protein